MKKTQNKEKIRKYRLLLITHKYHYFFNFNIPNGDKPWAQEDHKNRKRKIYCGLFDLWWYLQKLDSYMKLNEMTVTANQTLIL